MPRSKLMAGACSYEENSDQTEVSSKRTAVQSWKAIARLVVLDVHEVGFGRQKQHWAFPGVGSRWSCFRERLELPRRE